MYTFIAISVLIADQICQSLKFHQSNQYRQEDGRSSLFYCPYLCSFFSFFLQDDGTKLDREKRRVAITLSFKLDIRFQLNVNNSKYKYIKTFKNSMRICAIFFSYSSGNKGQKSIFVAILYLFQARAVYMATLAWNIIISRRRQAIFSLSTEISK